MTQANMIAVAPTVVSEHRKIKIKLIRSVIGVRGSHKATVLGLGLRKVNSISELADTKSVRGMINKVGYLLEIIV